ncbi:MATE family efflux transporter, partial [Enterocloster bolteae]|uniref:MATE family efflux transporter n=1 Tax=Enterocloster bolteae TaxID=208479 RepID=UPI00210C0DFA|nr:MATE family efflux transporter [Enterocloster bolteae]
MQSKPTKLPFEMTNWLCGMRITLYSNEPDNMVAVMDCGDWGLMINQAALTAVSMAFPIQNLLIAVSAGTCVGVNALLSRSLGEKNSKAANLAAANGLFL